MKETFEVFKLEDGKYFKDFNGWGVSESDTLSNALWIDGDTNEELIEQIRNLKGEFVVTTLTDEQPLPKKLAFNKRGEPATFKGKIAMIKREQHFSEETLSKMIGCGKSTVHGWLHGSVPSRKFRKKIEELYKSYYEE